MYTRFGWTIAGGRVGLVAEYVTPQGRRVQLVRHTRQTGPHSGPEQFKQVFYRYAVVTHAGEFGIDAKSRATKAELRMMVAALLGWGSADLVDVTGGW